MIYGGGQENGLRSGTENLPGIAGFGAAAALRSKNLIQETETMERIREQLWLAVSRKLPEALRISPAYGAPHILNMAFPGIRAEVLLHSLEGEGIYVGVGSACSSHKKGLSTVLTAMGIKREAAEGSLRFSFSASNTVEEAEKAAEALIRCVRQLSGFSRR